MSLLTTPYGERTHIGIFGRCNAGKSTLINAITRQELALVSDVAGTTTDPVRKSMEILPLGPVVLIDTPGLDDDSELGLMRVERAYKELDGCDIAILVLSLEEVFDELNEASIIGLIDRVRQRGIPLIYVVNKIDESLIVPIKQHLSVSMGVDEQCLCLVSALKGDGIDELKELIAHTRPVAKKQPLVSDLVGMGDDIILVVPIDESAPKGRIILPQQQVIRDALEAGAFIHVCKDTEYPMMLRSIKEPNNLLVVTDSQAFRQVAEETPSEYRLTSFSILMARYKGDLHWQVRGVRELSDLSDGDRILIAEGCTHHRQCGDIGTVKLPRMICEYSGVKPQFTFTGGGEYPGDLSEYRLIIHCGGCMLGAEVMRSRIDQAKDNGVPITNYGTAIAYMNGILDRCMEVFE